MRYPVLLLTLGVVLAQVSKPLLANDTSLGGEKHTENNKFIERKKVLCSPFPQPSNPFFLFSFFFF